MSSVVCKNIGFSNIIIGALELTGFPLFPFLTLFVLAGYFSWEMAERLNEHAVDDPEEIANMVHM